ncbi:sulfite exporter TauE/SafE family protein [Vannielia litorea]|uniref:sulfite exporter TauE/SafE family protein n=1 Tax=Vannielia litorea TaxID=1217970 RepID=UPI001C977742|nr:sulfite exporter TauE/SafE family protein [Vannielia litorea]MBY6046639.1 sulfite exporter TauE/SafE family protein [Vannielia litorea]MBY6074053.1 sulfite exporter TauE/SafE family protein [Vannielia litorea]
MEFWIVAALAAFMMGLSKGGVPMLAMLSVPLMSLFMDPALAAGLLLPLYIVADWYAVYLFRRAFSVRLLKIMLPGAVAGIVAAFFAVSVVPGDAIKMLVAGIGIYYLVGSVKGRFAKKAPAPREADVPRGVFWGTLAGFTSYISHAGGPPFQAYVLPQKLDKMVYLGTVTIFFSVVNLLKVPPYVMAGQITGASLGEAVWLAPFALAGAWSGSRVARWLPEKVFYLLVEVALAVVSGKLVWEVLVG